MTWTMNQPPIPLNELPAINPNNDFDLSKDENFLSTVLNKNLLFTGVDSEYQQTMVSRVVELLKPRYLKKDDILIRQGDAGDAFYLVEKGSFDILVTSYTDDGEEKEINKVSTASRGVTVGEYALLYNQPRTATLKATEDSTVWFITKKQFHDIRQEIMEWNVKRFEERKKFLGKIPIFSQLVEHELLNLTHACHAQIYGMDEEILSKDITNNDLYIIKSGTVLVKKRTIENGQSLMNVLNYKKKEELSDDIKHDDDTVNNDTPTQSSKHKSIIDKTPKSKSKSGLKKKNGFKFSLSKSMSKHDQQSSISVKLLDNNPKNEVSLKLISSALLDNEKPALSESPKGPMIPKLQLSENKSNSKILNGLKLNEMEAEQEYTSGDYFARQLFTAIGDSNEIVVSAISNDPQCNILRIRRDDFNLIMALKNSPESTMTMIKGVEDVLQDQLPDRWKNKLSTKLNDLKKLKVLGVGSFGKVFLAKDKNTNETYALKEIKIRKVIEAEQTTHILNEKKVLAMLNSDFSVRLLATYKSNRCVYFLTNVVLGGELFSMLRYNEKFGKNETRFYGGCVVLAIQHLHSKNIIYRDLKPENLLLNSKGYLILTDFGFAKRRNTTCSLCGTPAYLAPEVIHNWIQSFAVDWWALGVLLYEMIVGHAPFEDDEANKMFEKILIEDPIFPDDISAKLKDLISKLLEKNAYQRLGAGINGAIDVKEHEFFKKFPWIQLENQSLEAPYKPSIKSNTDTSHFDNFDACMDEEDDDDDFDEKSDDLNLDEYDEEYVEWINQF